MPRLKLPTSAWPGPPGARAPEMGALALAVFVSVLLHAIVLALSFTAPDPSRKLAPAQLEVVLVNSKTRSRPVKPDVLAQANLDGGGNTDEDRRAKTPLPVLQHSERGNDIKQATRRVQELEAKQRQLLSQLKPTPTPAPVAQPKAQEKTEAQPPVSGSELASSAMMIARMEAQVARSIEEYNKRPRKNFVGARASEARFALYVEDWRQKVERIGNLNYPDGARGRIYGTLRLTVSINADGSLASVDLERSSGQKILDAAATRIVQMAAPYGKFPPDIRKDTDILVITRTWHFAPGDRVFSE
jgi:protein TonB